MEYVKDADESAITGESRNPVPPPDVTLTENASGSNDIKPVFLTTIFCFSAGFLFTTRNCSISFPILILIRNVAHLFTTQKKNQS